MPRICLQNINTPACSKAKRKAWETHTYLTLRNTHSFFSQYAEGHWGSTTKRIISFPQQEQHEFVQLFVQDVPDKKIYSCTPSALKMTPSDTLVVASLKTHVHWDTVARYQQYMDSITATGVKVQLICSQHQMFPHRTWAQWLWYKNQRFIQGWRQCALAKMTSMRKKVA